MPLVVSHLLKQQKLIMVFCFSPLPRSGLSQQQLHGDKRLEDPQHGEKQVVCVHGQKR